MFTAEAEITTERSSRYLVQLCKHANQMGQRLSHRPRTRQNGDTPPQVQHVEWSDTYGIVKLNLGQWTIQAAANTLTLCAEADDEDNLRRIQDLLARRLETVGQRDDLKVHWQATAIQPRSIDPAPTATVAPRRSHRRMILLVAAGAVAVAVHLGLGGAVLASMKWTGWAADAVLAIVLLKVVAAVAIGLHRRSARHRKVE